MLIDISCNITDSKFKNIDKIVQKCRESQIIPFFVGLDYETSQKCQEYAVKYNTFFYAGIHPLHSQGAKTFKMEHSRMIANGECGLDYYRLHYSPKNIQKKIFIEQLDLKGERYFLHSRDSHRDFMDILSDYTVNGIVHSFTGTIEESQEIIKKDFFIGINGCSCKTEEGLEVIRNLPIDRILVETDSPYCKIRRSYAGYKYISNYTNQKSNEPHLLNEVVEIIANVKELDLEYLKGALLQNSLTFFGDKLQDLILDWK